MGIILNRENSIKSIRRCSVCNGNEVYDLYRQRFIGLEASPITADYHIVTCKQCGFTYADTVSSQKDYDQYYKYLSKYEDEKASGSGIQSTPYDEKRLIESAGLIEEYVSKEKSVIDIGCANGGLLQCLKARGYEKLTGVDPASTCVEHIISKGIQGYQGNLFEINCEKKYDVVVLTHVLEHIRDLKGAVHQLKQLVQQNGILYVEVPDAGKYDECFVVPYYFFDGEHINHFDIHTLQNFLVGFECLFIEEVVQQVSEQNVYPVLRGVFKRKENKHELKIGEFKAYYSVKKHIEQSKEAFNKLKVIDELMVTQEPITVWGAGQYAQRLLGTTNLDKCNIQVFIDNDSNKQGKKLLGIEIKTKDVIQKMNGKIVVCCALASHHIIDEINRMKVTNKIVVL